MKLKNASTNKTVSNDVFEAKSFKDKLFGLTKIRGQTLILRTRFGIHTFGLTHPIDVLILDRQNRVAKLISSLPSNRIFLWNPKYSKVIELSQGKIKQTNISIGDKLEIKE